MLPQTEQLKFIDLYGRECKNNLVTLYFELIADLDPDDIPQAASIIKKVCHSSKLLETLPSCLYVHI